MGVTCTFRSSEERVSVLETVEKIISRLDICLRYLNSFQERVLRGAKKSSLLYLF